MKWIVSQFGAREHYAIPRGLLHSKKDFDLYTDIWVKNVFLRKLLSSSSRYQPELREKHISHFSREFILRKFAEKISVKASNADQQFDYLISKELAKYEHQKGVFFGYSYSSRESLKVSKKLGIQTILGQINPGPGEAEIVKNAYLQEFGEKYPFSVPDENYWDLWREEVYYSDRIIVNSTWSYKLLEKGGVDPRKMVIVPLVFEPGFINQREKIFQPDREQLKVLYLGAISVRKGFHVLKKAMQRLAGSPVKFQIAGRLNGPAELIEGLPENVTLYGHVDQKKAKELYDQSHIFILPTLSDGFAITQLEAQHHGLPLIVSRNCAEVVEHMNTGFLLNEITEEEIIKAVTFFLDQPEKIEEFSSSKTSFESYGLAALAKNLIEIEQDLSEE